MLKIILILFLLCIVSCRKGIDVEVQNDSTKHIDSIKLTNGFDNYVSAGLKPNDSIKGFLNFSEEVKNDGGYGVIIYSDSSLKEYRFGYYSNGIPLSDSFKIFVLNDTIRVDEKFK